VSKGFNEVGTKYVATSAMNKNPNETKAAIDFENLGLKLSTSNRHRAPNRTISKGDREATSDNVNAKFIETPAG
jgi:hypothetical protein